MNRLPFIQIKNNPHLIGQVKLEKDIVYSTATGTELVLHLLLPWGWDDPEIPKKKQPLIVFVQGSGWTVPNYDNQLPQMAGLARKGYVVAMVMHRNAEEGHPFPAFLQDVKCAIRFLRKNADLYGIDPERVAILGTSSGGNTALLVGLTAGERAYETDEYPEYSDEVNVVVECFGPANIKKMAETVLNPDNCPALFYGLFGRDPELQAQRIHDMSPVNYVKEGKRVPPFLLLHGDADELVYFDQTEEIFEKMLACGYEVTAYQIQGAPHEYTFWSPQIYQIIEEYIAVHLKN